MGWLDDVLGLWRTWRRARAIARHLAAADHAARRADFHHQRAGWFIRDRRHHIARANDLRRGALMQLALPRSRAHARLRIVHIRAGRRARTAQAMAAAGFPAWRIRTCLGMTVAAVAAALAAGPSPGLWSVAERAALDKAMQGILR